MSLQTSSVSFKRKKKPKNNLNKQTDMPVDKVRKTYHGMATGLTFVSSNFIISYLNTERNILFVVNRTFHWRSSVCTEGSSWKKKNSKLYLEK